jgi:hypothetical protein
LFADGALEKTGTPKGITSGIVIVDVFALVIKARPETVKVVFE